MKIYEYPWDTAPSELRACTLALGLFDGVHIAHREIIERARDAARERGVLFGIFTFRSDGDIKPDAARIYSDAEKLSIMEGLGADITILTDFSAIRDLSAREFVKDLLIDTLGCKCCVAGFNFRFGKGAHADAHELISLMREYGGDAVILDELTVGGKTVSATLVRSLLSDGQVEKARALLVSPYFMLGRVERGNRVGRTLGYPTVNLPLSKGRAVPRLGVYRSAVAIDGSLYSAVTNVGVCPTFDERSVHSETYIIDFEGDVYGRDIRVYLLGFLRDEMKFDSAEKLAEQISIDKYNAIKGNGDLTWQELGLS